MPTGYIGFTLKPLNFFDANPALGVPPSTPHTCQSGGHLTLPGDAHLAP